MRKGEMRATCARRIRSFALEAGGGVGGEGCRIGRRMCGRRMAGKWTMEGRSHKKVQAGALANRQDIDRAGMTPPSLQYCTI
jgi:hypothetical protein